MFVLCIFNDFLAEKMHKKREKYVKLIKYAQKNWNINMTKKIADRQVV